jgi:hypothetical protein
VQQAGRGGARARVAPGLMSSKAGHLKDEGSRLQVTAAGATAGMISRYATNVFVLPTPIFTLARQIMASGYTLDHLRVNRLFSRS